MKRLTLIRHAHAVAEQPGISDFDRPLSRCGQAQAEALGQHLLDRNHAVDGLITSPAQRARQTTDLVALSLALPEQTVRYEDSLYLAVSTQILRVIQSTEPGIQHLVIVGHNPGLSQLTGWLTADAAAISLGTAAACSMNFAVSVWSAVGAGQALDIAHLSADKPLQRCP